MSPPCRPLCHICAQAGACAEPGRAEAHHRQVWRGASSVLHILAAVSLAGCAASAGITKPRWQHPTLRMLDRQHHTFSLARVLPRLVPTCCHAAACPPLVADAPPGRDKMLVISVPSLTDLAARTQADLSSPVVARLRYPPLLCMHARGSKARWPAARRRHAPARLQAVLLPGAAAPGLPRAAASAQNTLPDRPLFLQLSLATLGAPPDAAAQRARRRVQAALPRGPRRRRLPHRRLIHVTGGAEADAGGCLAPASTRALPRLQLLVVSTVAQSAASAQARPRPHQVWHAAEVDEIKGSELYLSALLTYAGFLTCVPSPHTRPSILPTPLPGAAL
jgi:hypothetical protein